MDLFWVANAELALKKGDSAAAKKALTEARKVNRAVKLSDELQKLK
jgi:phage shock protein A